MTFAHKIRKAFRLKTYTEGRAIQHRDSVLRFLRAAKNPRSWWGAVRRRRAMTVDSLLTKFDAGEFERIKARYGEGKESYWTKYLDTDKWLRTNLAYVRRFDMIDNPPRDVLDLGCGSGWFLFVCKQLGCRGLGVDLDTDPIFNEMIKLFKVERIAWRMEPFVKLPDFHRKFDFITAFMICFNNFDTEAIWKAPQWAFLIDDLAGRLTPNGRILFSFNHQLDGVLFPDDIHELLLSRGAKFNGKEVLFTKAGLDASATRPVNADSQTTMAGSLNGVQTLSQK